MSFLNPVNEPVLQYKSTDAGAPQINYNARVAGDVKAVLKACLVTGYGATASAGWAIINEVAHVAEFVSPSATMSDYRLGIDDTSTSSTTWYYQYQNVRTDPSYNTPKKSFTSANKTHADNGWQLIATARGFIFVELIQQSTVNKLSARLTYFGQVKSALVDNNGPNMMFFNIGHNGAIANPQALYDSTYPSLKLASYSSTRLLSSTPFALAKSTYTLGVSVVDITSAIYALDTSGDLLIAQVGGLLTRFVNDASKLYGISEQNIDGRPALSVTAGWDSSVVSTSQLYARNFLIYLDY